MSIKNLERKDDERDKDELNNAIRNVSLSNNFSGTVIENITLPIGEEVEIPHNLKSVPKFRIILRQRGELTIIDGDTPWTDTAIYLKAVGGAGGSFTTNIALLEKGTNAFSDPTDPSCRVGNYSVTSHITNGAQMLISASCLNAAFSGGGGSSTEATISILLTRG